MNRVFGTIFIVIGLLFALFLFIVCKQTLASPIFPPMVGGDFKFKVQAVTPLDADGVPIEPPTRSIAVIPQAGDALLACTDTPDPNGTYEFLVSIAATGVRQSFKAFAYSEVACGGVVSDASENTAYTYPGMSPHPPDLQ